MSSDVDIPDNWESLQYYEIGSMMLTLKSTNPLLKELYKSARNTVIEMVLNTETWEDNDITKLRDLVRNVKEKATLIKVGQARNTARAIPKKRWNTFKNTVNAYLPGGKARINTRKQKRINNLNRASGASNEILAKWRKNRKEFQNNLEKAREHSRYGKEFQLSGISSPASSNILNDESNVDLKKDRDELHRLESEASESVKSIFTSNPNSSQCDSEGFYQHSGECWNDSIQMIFLFTDGLKEIVQQKLALTDIDSDFISEESLAYIVKIYSQLYKKYKAVPEHIRNELILYFKAFKRRFIRHYVNEKFHRQEPLLDSQGGYKNPIEELHVMGRDGISSATHGKGSTTIYSIKNRLTFFKERDIDSESDREYVSNVFGNLEDILFLMAVYIKLFFNKEVWFPFSMDIRAHANAYITAFTPFVIPEFSSVKKTDIGFNYYGRWMGLKKLINFFDNTKLDNELRAILCISFPYMHANTFYTCGNRDFFYEDNYGPFIFPWKDMFKNDKDIIYICATGRLVINKKTVTDLYPVIVSRNKFKITYYTYYNNTKYVLLNSSGKYYLGPIMIIEGKQHYNKDSPWSISFNRDSIRSGNDLTFFYPIDYKKPDLSTVENFLFNPVQGVRKELHDINLPSYFLDGGRQADLTRKRKSKA